MLDVVRSHDVYILWCRPICIRPPRSFVTAGNSPPLAAERLTTNSPWRQIPAGAFLFGMFCPSQLALRGGHEPVRARLAAVGVFVNAVQVFRETKTKRGPSPQASATPAVVVSQQRNGTPPSAARVREKQAYSAQHSHPARRLDGVLSCVSASDGFSRCIPDEITSCVSSAGMSQRRPKPLTSRVGSNGSTATSIGGATVKREGGDRTSLCSSYIATVPGDTGGIIDRIESNQSDRVLPSLRQDVTSRCPRLTSSISTASSTRTAVQVTPSTSFQNTAAVASPLQPSSER